MTDNKTTVHVSLPADTLAALTEFAHLDCRTRSSAARYLIETGLQPKMVERREHVGELTP